MISKSAKIKFNNSFNQFIIALHNLKSDIAAEGKKAFMECNSQDISELTSLMNKINELNNKVDKISPIFKTYALDIATDQHPAEFPLNDTYEDATNKELKSMIQGINNNENKDKTKEAKEIEEEAESIKDKDMCKDEVKYPIDCRYEDIQCMILADKEYMLLKNSAFIIEEKPSTISKYTKLSNEGKLFGTYETDNVIRYIVREDIKFVSADSLMGLVLNKRVRNGTKLLKLLNGYSISTIV